MIGKKTKAIEDFWQRCRRDHTGAVCCGPAGGTSGSTVQLIDARAQTLSVRNGRRPMCAQCRGVSRVAGRRNRPLPKQVEVPSVSHLQNCWLRAWALSNR